MEKIESTEKHSSTTTLLRSINTISVNLVLAGIIFLITQSVKNSEDILVIKEKVEADHQKIINLQAETDKISGMQMNVQLMQHDLKSIEERLSYIK